ncbi:MAG: TonB-dependent receptor [Deltaproteobacteria bacterium]|jgi:vitamin B12 transporter|nr:TonB-dependent receptor [Deltaproteobacteria bacterium]
MRKSLLFFLSLSILNAPHVLAATEVTLEEIVVSANKIATPAAQTSTTVNLTDKEELETAQRHTLEEAVTQLPGVYSVTPGQPVSPNRIFIRGAPNRFSQIRYNDFPLRDPSSLNNDFGSFQNSLLLPPGGVERIEVLKGAQSTLYGSSAVGGVISIFPEKTWESGFHGNFRGAWGTYGAVEMGADFSYGDEKYYLRASPMYTSSEGFPDIPYQRQALALGAGARLSPADSLELDVYHTAGSQDNASSPSWDAALGKIIPQSPQDGRIDSDYTLAGLTYKRSFGDSWEARLKGSYSSGNREYIDPLYGDSAYKSDLYYTEMLHSLTPLEFLTLIAGADYEGMSAEMDNSYDSVDKFFNSGSFFAKAVLSFFEQRLNFDLGGRYNLYDHFDGAFVYNLGAAYAFDFGLRLYANTGTGYRTPSVYEMYGETYNFLGQKVHIGNTKLDPESSRSYEAGLEQKLLDDKISLGAAWFHTEIEDMITMNYTLLSPYYNVPGKTRNKGFEFSAGLAPHEKIRIHLAYLTLKAEEKTPGGWSEALSTPENRFTGTLLLYPFSGLSLAFTGRWQDKTRINVYDSFYNALEMRESGFFTLDLAAAYALDENVTFFGKVNNALDKKYTLDAYAMPGVTCSLGLKVGF